MTPEDSNALEISVVVPVYRSQSIVAELCAAIREALEPFRYELVLVNDCSPDDSWLEIRREALADKRIIGVNLRVNGGQDRAIMAGLHFTRGAYVVVMDDDLQHDPREIPHLYEKVIQGSDVCFASFVTKKQTLVKNFGSYLAGKIAERVLRKPPDIYLSPFKIVRREVVNEVIRYRGPFPYVDGLILQTTSNVVQISAEHHKRFEGSSTHNLWKQATVFFTLVTNFSLLPLRAATAIGVACLGLSVLAGLYFFLVYLRDGSSIFPWAAVGMLQLFLSGAILVAMGLLGEYIGRALLTLNQSPQFVVKETLNAN